jgi:hypothetical protein
MLSACTSNKNTFLCGEQNCKNKKEAAKYFNKTLSYEISKEKSKKTKNIDLIGLNMNTFKTKKKFNIFNKKPELMKIEKNIYKPKTKNSLFNKISDKIDKTKNDRNSIINTDSTICSVNEKCNIDDIAEKIIKENKQKDFPKLNF